MLLAQLSVLDATVVSVVNEGGKYNRHECHRVRGNSVRVVVHSMGRFFFRVQVWGDDPLEELVDAHGNVTCMLKVAEWVGVTCGKQSLAAHNDMPRNIDFRRVHLPLPPRDFEKNVSRIPFLLTWKNSLRLDTQ